MQKIVIDLEFSPIGKAYREERKICRHEIIQIGAVKLDDADSIVDSYNCLVKPEYSEITEKVTELTHITNEMVEKAPAFEEAMNDFLNWIGDEETVLYAWSDNDERQLRKESKLKEYDNEKLNALLEGSEDLQKIFTNSLGLEKAMSLTMAIEIGNIGFDGQAHSADSDAYNTAVLYQIMADEELFRGFYDVALDLLAPKEALSFSLGSLFTPDMMAQIAC